MTSQQTDTAPVDRGSKDLSLAAFRFVRDHIGLDGPENERSEDRVDIRRTLDDIAGILQLDHTERSALRSRREAGVTEPLHPLVRRLRLHVASRLVDPSRGTTTRGSQYDEDDADATLFDGFTRYLSTRLTQAPEASEAASASHAPCFELVDTILEAFHERGNELALASQSHHDSEAVHEAAASHIEWLNEFIMARVHDYDHALLTRNIAFRTVDEQRESIARLSERLTQMTEEMDLAQKALIQPLLPSVLALITTLGQLMSEQRSE